MNGLYSANEVGSRHGGDCNAVGYKSPEPQWPRIAELA